MPLMAISGAFYSIASTFAILSIYEQPQSKNALIDKKSATLGLPSEEQIALEGTSTTYLKTILEKIKPPPPSELNQNYMDCLRTLTALSEDAQSPGDIWWHPATLTWLNDYPSYRSWLESRDPSVLHFYGKTGCGKSTALFYILDDLQTTFSSQISIVSFAFDQFDKRKNTTRAMLLSFARQLLLLQPSLFSLTTWPDGSDTNYTTGELNKVLKAMLRCSTVISTTFLIDAVDECDGNPMGFLRDLVTLGRDAPEAVFKVIITSRSQQETLEWQGVTYLPVDLDNVEELTRDKVRVAEAGILALTQKQPALLRYRDTLISKLCSAKTTFLEIVLRLEQLGMPRFASTPTTILKELETPPRSLPQICEDILEHLSGENRLWALNALLWVFYAVRPLKPYELASALAIEETTGLCLESGVSLDIIGDLRQTLGSLLATRNGEFHFVHDSVRDYLDTHKTFQQTGHEYLFRCCLTYLSSKLDEDVLHVVYNKDIPMVAIPERSDYGIMSYVIQNWPGHYRKLVDSDAVRPIARQFLHDKAKMKKWNELYSCTKHDTKTRIFSQSELVFAAEHGLVDLLNEILANGTSTPSEREVALNLAAENNHLETVDRILDTGVEIQVVIEAARRAAASADKDGQVLQHLLRKAMKEHEANITSYYDILLCSSAQNGQRDVIEILLNMKPEDIQWDQGHSPLHLAAANGYESIVKLLLDRTIVPTNLVDNDGMTALHRAAANGHSGVVAQLLEAGAEKNVVESTRQKTPLHLGAQGGHSNVVQSLIEKEVDREAQDSAGYRPLHLAALHGRREVVRILIDAGVDGKAVTGSSDTALHLAAQSGHLETVRLLLKNGSDPNAGDLGGCTPLHRSVQGGHIDVSRELLDNGSTVDAPDDAETRPIHFAVKGDPALVELLLKHRADGNILDSSRKTALHNAVSVGNLEAVKMLLANDVDVDPADRRKQTPLYLAATNDQLEIVVELLRNGADTEIPSDKGWRPLHAASKNAEITTALLENGAKLNTTNLYGSTALTLAAQNGCEAVVKVLLDAGANPRISSSNGTTSLHRAAQNGYLEVVQLLLNAGANPLAEKDNMPKTPVDTAIVHNHDKILEIMLSSLVGEEKSTRLHTAVKKQLEPIVSLLLDPQRGYDINAKDKLERTALFYSIAGGFKNITTRLLEKGIDTELHDCDGRFAIDMARSKNMRQLILTKCQAKTHSTDSTDEDGSTNSADNVDRNDDAQCVVLSKMGCIYNRSSDWELDFGCDYCDKSLDGCGLTYHCCACHDDDFDICQSCYDDGKRCKASEDTCHTLKVRFLKNGLISFSEFCEWLAERRMPGELGAGLAGQ